MSLFYINLGRFVHNLYPRIRILGLKKKNADPESSTLQMGYFKTLYLEVASRVFEFHVDSYLLIASCIYIICKLLFKLYRLNTSLCIHITTLVFSSCPIVSRTVIANFCVYFLFFSMSLIQNMFLF